MGNNLPVCCEAESPRIIAKQPNPTDLGGSILECSDSESDAIDDSHVEIPDTILEGYPPEAALKTNVLETLKKPPDLESINSGHSSESSEIQSTSKRYIGDPTLPQAQTELSERHSETPIFCDNSEPPTLDFNNMTVVRPRKMGKQVSFAEFPRDMEQGEIYTPTPRKLESSHFVSWTPRSSTWGTPCTPSMLLGSPLSQSMLADSPMTPSILACSPAFGRQRALQSVGEIPSTPSIDHIYFQNQQEVKTNFYSQPSKAAYTKPTHIVTPTQLKPRANLLHPRTQHKASDDQLYINSTPGATDTLEVPMSTRSVGTLPPSPIFDSLLAEAEGSEAGISDEPRHVLYDTPDSDTDSDSENEEENTQLEESEDETEDTTSVGGEEFMTSKAWFLSEPCTSPVSVLSFSCNHGYE